MCDKFKGGLKVLNDRFHQICLVVCLVNLTAYQLMLKSDSFVDDLYFFFYYTLLFENNLFAQLGY